MDMTLFLRASIPSIPFTIIAVVQIVGNRFWVDDIPLQSFEGHVCVLDIENVA